MIEFLNGRQMWAVESTGSNKGLVPQEALEGFLLLLDLLL